MLGFLEKTLGGWCSLLIASGCDGILNPRGAGEQEGMTWLENLSEATVGQRHFNLGIQAPVEEMTAILAGISPEPAVSPQVFPVD